MAGLSAALALAGVVVEPVVAEPEAGGAEALAGGGEGVGALAPAGGVPAPGLAAVPEGALPGELSPGGRMTSMLWITTGFRGASRLNGPNEPVGTSPMASTTLIPWITLPKTV